MRRQQERIAKLLEAAESAADWLCDSNKGTDQHERGEALRDAILDFTRPEREAALKTKTT